MPGLLCGLFALAACTDAGSGVPDGGAATREARATEAGQGDGGEAGLPLDGHADAGGEIAHGASLPALCARDRSDAVRDVFCAPDRPTIGGLADLLEALQIVLPGTGSGDLVSPFPGIAGGNSNVVALGHSTALSGHRVSPINPRLIVTGPAGLLAYQRGVQKVELIAFERKARGFNFYLIRFEQACNRRSDGCLPGDLYTPNVERDWLSWTIEDDEDLKNTPDDCRQCHQRARDIPALLMRELNNPWTHFLQPIEPAPFDPGPGVQGPDLMRDYLAAKGDEPYGGYTVGALASIAPFLLEGTVGIDQPVLFDAPGIEHERFPYDPESGYPDEPGASPTWEAAYQAFKRGEQLALPYLEPRAADVEKLARLSEAYSRFRAGELSADDLPDLSDSFPDDPMVRARIGLQTEPGSDPAELLIQACGSCHNDVLDQTISRARFNINLWQVDGGDLARAVERIERAPGEPGVMPPPEARQLDREGRARLLDYLMDDPLAADPDPRLVEAARLGMAGGADRRAFERR